MSTKSGLSSVVVLTAVILLAAAASFSLKASEIIKEKLPEAFRAVPYPDQPDWEASLEPEPEPSPPAPLPSALSPCRCVNHSWQGEACDLWMIGRPCGLPESELEDNFSESEEEPSDLEGEPGPVIDPWLIPHLPSPEPEPEEEPLPEPVEEPMAESEEPVPEVDLHLIGRLPEGSSVKEEDRGEVTEAQLKERLRELPSLSPPPPPPPWVSGPEEPVPVQVETPDSEGQLQIDPWMIHQLEEEQSAPSPIPAYLPSVLRDDQPSPAPLESTDLLANLGQTARQKNEWDYAYYGTGVYEGEDIRIDISGQKVVPGHLELGLETALAGGAAGLATSPLWIPTALATAGTAYAAAEPYLYPAGQLANSAILAGSATEIISGVTMGVTQNLEDTGQISSSQAEYIYPMAEVFGGTGQVTGGVGVATANIVQGVYGAGEFMTSVSESARRGYEGWEVMSDYDAWGTGYTDRYGGYAMPINGEEEAWYQRKQLLAEGRWQTLRELEAGTLGSIRRNDQYDWNRPPLERVYFGEEMDIYERMGVKVEFKPLGEILGRTRPGVIEIDDSLISEDPTLALTVFSHEAHHVEELSLRRSVMQKNYGGYSWRKATYGQIKKGDVFPEGPYNIVQQVVREEINARLFEARLADLMGIPDGGGRGEAEWLQAIIAEGPDNPAKWLEAYELLQGPFPMEYFYQGGTIVDPSRMLPAP